MSTDTPSLDDLEADETVVTVAGEVLATEATTKDLQLAAGTIRSAREEARPATLAPLEGVATATATLPGGERFEVNVEGERPGACDHVAVLKGVVEARERRLGEAATAKATVDVAAHQKTAQIWAAFFGAGGFSGFVVKLLVIVVLGYFALKMIYANNFSDLFGGARQPSGYSAQELVNPGSRTRPVVPAATELATPKE